MPNTAVTDIRWRRLTERPWKCSKCQVEHSGIFDLACFAPAAWRHDEAYEPNSALRMDGDFLSEDFCVIDGQNFLVRGVLQLPLLKSGGLTFGYGVWSTLSRSNFEKYLADFDSGHVGKESWFGWFLNALKGYEPSTYALKCNVEPQPNRMRPLIFLEPTDHPLAREQADGISYERLMEIYALHGHAL